MGQKATRSVTYCTNPAKFDKRYAAQNLIWALYGADMVDFVQRVATGTLHTSSPAEPVADKKKGIKTHGKQNH